MLVNIFLNEHTEHYTNGGKKYYYAYWGSKANISIEKINNYWIDIVAKAGVKIKSVEVCPHRDEENCDCRKPKTGLLKNAE